MTLDSSLEIFRFWDDTGLILQALTDVRLPSGLRCFLRVRECLRNLRHCLRVLRIPDRLRFLTLPSVESIVCANRAISTETQHD